MRTASSFVEINGDNGSFYNSGRIIAEGRPIETTQRAVLVNGQNGVAVNDGYIFGEFAAIQASGDNCVVINNGKLESSNIAALAFGDVRIENYGVLDGGTFGIFADQGTAVVINQGRITGEIYLGNQATDDVYDGRGGFCDGLIRMRDGDDTAIGGNGTEVIWGEDGNDILRGRGGDDVLNGGEGSDRLVGGRGDDDLTGGAGGDVFVFQLDNGNDIVRDYQVGLELFDFSRTGATRQEIDAATSQTAEGVFIDFTLFGGSGSVLLEGVFMESILQEQILL